jgi:hypothetical protein
MEYRFQQERKETGMVLKAKIGFHAEIKNLGLECTIRESLGREILLWKKLYVVGTVR